MLRIAVALHFDSMRVDRISHAPGLASSICSTTSATDASPKMKWLSRSRQFMWPVVSSGTTTSAHFAVPAWIACEATIVAPVAAEQPSDMSSAQPRAPMASWTSIAIAGIEALEVRCAEHDEVDVFAASCPRFASARFAALTAYSAWMLSCSSGRSGMFGHMRSGSRRPVLSWT